MSGKNNKGFISYMHLLFTVALLLISFVGIIFAAIKMNTTENSENFEGYVKDFWLASYVVFMIIFFI